jgi:hypothetical protein
MRTRLRQSASVLHAMSAQWPRRDPSGLIRRGALLLLLLAFATTGCAGHTARQKVAMNRRESARSRLNVPPRSKAKAPVTPAASPQPDQEPGGRIF